VTQFEVSVHHRLEHKNIKGDFKVVRKEEIKTCVKIGYSPILS